MTVWSAVQAAEMPKDELPTDIFNASGERRLVVVTCGGPVMANGHYRDNVIVSFAPVS